MSPVPAALLEHVDRHDPGGVVGVYLYGSATSTGLQADSDVDLLLLTRRSLTGRERTALVALLLEISGWKGHADRFPDAAGRRPLEVTGLVLDDLRPLAPEPRRDFQYGEWLRADLRAGSLPLPVADADVVVLLATAFRSHRALRGPALADLLDPVPAALLRRALLTLVPGLVGEVVGDERNVLLTLARVLVTLETGRVVAKDAAADAVAPRLPADERSVLERARAGYLGQVHDDWSGWSEPVGATARALGARALRYAAP